jgi:uncharacterized membrane protein
MFIVTQVLSRVHPKKASAFSGGMIFVLALACGLRFYHLASDSLWMDELFSIWLAKQSFVKFWQVMSHENHPPLYYLMLSGWIKIFGSSAFAVRSLSAICGIAIIPVIFVAMRRLYNIQTAYYVATLTAVLPPLVRYSQEARMYAPVALFATIALVGALLYLQTPSKRHGILFAVGMTLALYTHYFSVFLWLMLVTLISGEIWLRQGLKAVKQWCLLCLIPLLAFVPWLSVIVSQYKENSATHWVAQMPAPSMEELLTFPEFCFGFYDQRWGMQLGYFGLDKPIISLVFSVVGLLMLPLIYKRNKENSVVKITPTKESVILPSLISIGMIFIIWSLCQIKNAWLLKYMIVAIPGLLISLGAWLFRTKPTLGKGLIAWFVLGNALCATVQTVGTMLPYNQEDWQKATPEIHRQIDAQTVILIADPMLRVCLTYYGIPEESIVTLGYQTMEYHLCGGMTPEQARQRLKQAKMVITITRFGNRGEMDNYLAEVGMKEPRETKQWIGLTVENFQRENIEHKDK